MVKCVVCLQRKRDRLCAALDNRICSACCGQKRQREIDCPKGCGYLIMGQKFAKEKEEKRLFAGKRMTDEFLDKYADVVQNIECVISMTARNQGDVIDRNVKDALEEAIRYYHSLNTKTEYSESFMPNNTMEVYVAILGILEYRQTQTELPFPKITNEEIIECLQRVLKSVKFHSSGRSDSTNYLDFIQKFAM